MDYTIHGILQARILEWVAIPFSRGSSQPSSQTRLPHCRWILYHLSHQGITSLWQPLIYFLSLEICLLWTSHINVIRQYMLVYNWLLALVGHDWATSLSLVTFMHWRRKWQPTPVVLAWRIPGTGEPGGLPSMGLHRVGHDWSDLAAAAAAAAPGWRQHDPELPWGQSETFIAS